MLKRVLLSFVIVLLYFPYTKCHDEYYKLLNGKLELLVVPPGSTSDMIVWSSSQASNIKVYFKNWSPAYLPAELGSVTSQTQVQEAWGLWHAEAPCVGFSETSTFTEGIHVSFSAISAPFPDPMADGATAHAVENSKIVISCSSCQNQTFTRTEVFFNNTSTFKAQFIWTNNLTGLASDRVCFKGSALHEFGHVIGLNHCSNSSAVMYTNSASGSDFKPPQPSDKAGLSQLCLVTPAGPCQGPDIPQNLTATIVGQNVVLNWGSLPSDCSGSWHVIPYLSKNGSSISIPDNATSYTDVNAVSSLPATYHVGFFDQGILISGDPATISVSVAQSNISQPTLWTGVVYVNSNITVNSILQIGASTNVVFQSGGHYGITVNGQLYAQGQSNGRVTFTSSSSTPAAGNWSGITISGANASNSTLQYCTVEYGYAVTCSGNPTNVTIDHCTIQNNSYGILCYSSSPLITNNIIQNNTVHGIQCASNSNPRIENNTITKNNINSGAGVYLYQASCYVNSNTITGFNVGLYPTYNSNLGGWSGTNYNYTPTQNNYIYGNMYGVATYGTSFAFLGRFDYNDWVVHGGNNWIENNIAYDFSVGSSTNLYAEGDWFGCDLYTTKVLGTNAYFYANGMLSTNPWGGTCGSFAKSMNENTNQFTSANQPKDDDEDEIALLDSAISDHFNKSYGKAKDTYKRLLSSKKYSKTALVLLSHLQSESKDENILLLYDDQVKKPNIRMVKATDIPLTTNLLANMYGQRGNYDESLALYTDVIKKYPNSIEERNARIQKIYYTVEGLNDINKAISQLKQLVSIYKEGDDIEMIKNLVKHSALLAGLSFDKLFNESFEQESLEETIPDHYELFQNYPNPFNPVTTIKYQIPKDGLVTLKIYDVLGREVITLVDEYKTVGNYTATFDASRYASGMYFYRFVSQAADGASNDMFSDVKKMLYLK